MAKDLVDIRMSAMSAYIVYYWLLMTTIDIEQVSGAEPSVIKMLKRAIEEYGDEFRSNIDKKIMDELDVSIGIDMFYYKAHQMINKDVEDDGEVTFECGLN